MQGLGSASKAKWLVFSVTRLGDFWNFLVTNFITKVSQMFVWLFGLMWKPSLIKSNWWGYLLGNFWKNLGYFSLQHLVTLLVLNQNWSIVIRPIVVCRLVLFPICIACERLQRGRAHHPSENLSAICLCKNDLLRTRKSRSC